jgi:hypothetical protein
MNKQELIEALTAKGIAFDKTQKVDELRLLLETAGGLTQEASDNAVQAKYVKNKENGRVFEATPDLLKMPEMVVIDDAEYNAALAG